MEKGGWKEGEGNTVKGKCKRNGRSTQPSISPTCLLFWG